ncbi:MAG: HD domain-containing protein [Candidatus Gracilibacteria bacterium]|nr:HD domain-containing protein [Candidatus Gracilibacteria bacterium]
MIVYHDFIEAETGDIDFQPTLDSESKRRSKKETEQDAMKVFIKKLPKEISKIYEEKNTEYEERQSLESKFVKLVDIVEPDFLCLAFPEKYKLWNKDFHIEKDLKYYNDFPELKFIFDELLNFLYK